MKRNHLLLLLCLLILPTISYNKNVSYRQHWRNIIFLEDLNSSQCSISENGCPKPIPYNNSNKALKTTIETINNASKEAIQTEKAIESFDEWTKKRRDAAANHIVVETSKIDETAVRRLDVVTNSPIISGPTRNFASKECGAKVIASNPEAENAKSILEKDVDDYMRNPCKAAKEKFVVIELCEAIQVKKIAVGNFELFASRPKQISVEISERYPPLGNWISVGTFQLQDHHKILQAFDVPNTNIYAKYVKINLEEHYGKEHYCIVTVVNVMGSTLTDEYEKEEAAVHLLNTMSEKGSGEKMTTPAPSEEKMQTQLPIPPKSRNKTIYIKSLRIPASLEICSMCPSQKVSYSICQLLPEIINRKPSKTNSELAKSKKLQRVARSQMSHATFEQLRRRNLAYIQRKVEKGKRLKNKEKVKKPEEKKNEIPTKQENEQQIETKPIENDAEKDRKIIPEKPIKPQKQEAIVPAGGSTNQREMVLMKLSKRIAAVEMNLTLTTEYLSELSKQYVAQMSGYQQELKETKRLSQEYIRNIEGMLRNKMNNIKREMRQFKNTLIVLQEYEKNRMKQQNYDMSRSIFVPSCHMTAPIPPQPTVARLPLIGGINENGGRGEGEEEGWKDMMERARSIMFGSVTWNTDHLIMALIISNTIVLSLLFASMFYIHRRNNSMNAEVRNELQRRIRNISQTNRKTISKGLRRAELAVTAAVTSSMKSEKAKKNQNVTAQFETALSNLFTAQQNRIDEQFEENKKLMKDVLLRNERTNIEENSESSSETEHLKDN